MKVMRYKTKLIIRVLINRAKDNYTDNRMIPACFNSTNRQFAFTKLMISKRSKQTERSLYILYR